MKMALLISCALIVVLGVGRVIYGTAVFVYEVLWSDETADGTSPERPREFCGCTRHSVKFKRDPYDLHRHHAEQLNEGVIVTESMVPDSRLLTEVEDGEGYRIDRRQLTHSVPYLNREAYRVLRDMGKAYASMTENTDAEGSTFHISSLTRTVEQQDKLRRSAKGVNATPNVSAHSYGASFDIYRIENTFSCATAQRAFEDMLLEFQKAGRILLCPEGNCIHVTVRR